MGLPLLHFIELGSPKIEFWELKVPEKSSNNYQYGKSEKNKKLNHALNHFLFGSRHLP